LRFLIRAIQSAPLKALNPLFEERPPCSAAR
jgi:hypothetical protein